MSSSLLEDFCRLADDVVREGGKLTCLSSSFGSLARSIDWVEQLLENEVARILAEPTYTGKNWEPNTLTVASGRGWTLKIGALNRVPDFIYSSPYDILLSVIAGGSLRVSHYLLSEGVDGCSSSENRSIKFLRQEILPEGRILEVDGAVAAVDVLPAETPSLTLKFSTAPKRPLQWAFSRDSLQATQAIAADPVDSELIVLFGALAAMGGGASATQLIKMTEHPTHFVRWAAVKALARVSPQTAINMLDRFLSDEHPHIRNAARGTIDRMGGGRNAATR